MVHKEVLTSIEEADFIEAGYRAIETGQALDAVNYKEKKVLRSHFKALGQTADRLAGLTYLGGSKKERKNVQTGFVKFGLAVKTYFETVLSEPGAEPAEAVTHRWLQGLIPSQTVIIAKRHVNHEKVLLDRAEREGHEDITPEMDATYDEYPAFIGFTEAYEDLLLENDVDSLSTSQICEGVLLGAVVIRESVELAEFEESHLPLFKSY
jgi:hypothetical protein